MELAISKTFTCAIENYFGNGQDLTETIIAKTASQARYSFYLKMDFDEPYKKLFKYIRVKTIGRTRVSDFFGDEQLFKGVCEKRHIEFCKQGMIIDVDGKKGIVVGANNHCNLEVVMEGTTHIETCHPHWQTTYYDDKMNIIKDFKVKK